MHFTPLEAFLTGHASMVVIAYAVRTIPQPKSTWGRWLVGILQFGVSNAELGQQALAGAPKSTSPAEALKP